MLSQTAIFTRRICDHLDPAVLVDADSRCGDLVALLRDRDAGAAVAVDADRAPVGIVTERDVVRRAAFTVTADTPVRRIMTAPVKTIDGGEYLHHAVARMRREAIRHLPVVRGGQVTGLLQLDRVLAALGDRAVAQINLVDADWRDPASLQAAKANQYKIAAQLLADQVPAAEIQQLLTRLNRELYRAAIKGGIAALADRLGPPPVAFDVVVMGSGGRGENFLTPDQDNGIVIADYPDTEHNRIDSWFIAFSEQLTGALDDIGLPFCHGNVMASNPLWRKTLSQWRAQVGGWIGKSEGNFLRLCDIFFDFDSVSGAGELTRTLRRFVTENAARPVFLREMYKIDEVHDVALGPFGILLKERQKGPNRGKLNLKITGTLPLVGAVRILALWRRVTARSTLERIDALAATGALSGDEQDELAAAYRHITGLLLRQQLRDAEAGLPPGSHVPPKALSRRERALLVDSFKAVRRFRSRLRTDLTGELF